MPSLPEVRTEVAWGVCRQRGRPAGKFECWLTSCLEAGMARGFRTGVTHSESMDTNHAGTSWRDRKGLLNSPTALLENGFLPSKQLQRRSYCATKHALPQL